MNESVFQGVANPLVSVLMPAYNRGAFIGAAIESVRKQTYPHWQLCVVDDGSKDETPQIIAALAAEDSRIRWQTQANSGQAVARNRALKMSTGSLVCFLDSDNLWLPGKLEQQVEIMQRRPEVGVLYGETDSIDADGNPLPPIRMTRHSGRITLPLLIDNFVNFNTSMTRREHLEAVGGLDERVRRADDYDLWLRLSAVCEFAYEPASWALYRIMPDQISSDKTGRFESNRAMLERFFANHPQFATPDIMADTWCRFHTRRGRYFASSGRRLQALQDFRLALGHRPLSRHPWRALARLVLKGG